MKKPAKGKMPMKGMKGKMDKAMSKDSEEYPMQSAKKSLKKKGK